MTATEQAEERLRKQSQWLRVTLASIGDGVISTDAHGRVTYMNPVAEQLTGWAETLAIHRPLTEVFQIVNERTREPVENPALRVLREGVVVGLANHTILIARDGSECPIVDRASPMVDDVGQVVGAVLVFRDVTEQKKAEQAQTRLAAIVESSQDAIISKTLDGIIRSWNVGAERLFGYTAEEAIGQSITFIIPPDRQHEEAEIIARLARGERIEHFETVRAAKCGKLVDISLTVSPLLDSEGHVVGASKIARDITAQKQAEAREQRLHRETEDDRSRLADVFQRAPSFLAVMRGPDHVFEMANDRYFELIGEREILGKPIRAALPEVEGQGFFELLDEVYESGEPFATSDMSITLQRRAGENPERLILEFVYQPLKDPDGSISGILAQGIDLTERRRTERKLAKVTAESERRRRLYETILTATPDFVYVFSLDHRVLYANDSLLTMWGRPSELVIGKTFLEIGYPDWHAAMHEREIDEVRATKQPIRGEVPFNGTYGRRIYDYIFVPVLGADGEVEAVAGTTRDVTERKEMEDILRETDRNKDEFIALLAHELRNPLAPLRSGLEVMRMAESNPAAMAEAQDIMDRQLEHMVRLIDDLLDISRLSQGKIDLRRTRVTLAEVIRSAIETADSMIQSAGHELTVELPPAPIYLNADLTRLAQVFSNLLTNSAKYTEPGGQIWVTARCTGAEVEISVRDTGIGILPSDLPRVFEMFSQVDGHMERSNGGLGIGLALVKGLVAKHEGSVHATSEGEGKGSTFTVRLPVKDGSGNSTAEIQAVDEVKETEKAAKRRVLVVDDNHDSAEMMTTILDLMGNEVMKAHDGTEAVEAAANFQPDVILMDVGMPRLNGHEATKQIRAQEKEKKAIIIALTGWGQETDRALSRAAGCDGHLVKPVNMPDLEKMLAELEEGR
ncbi:MAG: PAS domain S-box protein [Pirellulaceae bacterium]